MTLPSQLQFIQADYDEYQAKIEGLRPQFLDYPRHISIETQVRCNAKCGFCPYPTSPRQGQEMSDATFEKIACDLSRIPADHACGVTLHRINEPLLDKRLQRFSRLIAQALPSAVHQFWSNGTMLKPGLFEWMADYPSGILTVSLNSMDEIEHKQLMGFGLGTVNRCLDYLHGLVETGQFPLPVTLCGPYHSEESATRFQQSCQARWPRFRAASRPFFQWMGETRAGSDYRVNFGLPSKTGQRAANFACGQWFDLHILANGRVTKCSIDETGYVDDAFYDVNQHDVLEIYRRRLSARRHLPPRDVVQGCQGCFHLG